MDNDHSLIADLIMFDIPSTMIISLSFLRAFHLLPLKLSNLNKGKATWYKMCIATASSGFGENRQPFYVIVVSETEREVTSVVESQRATNCRGFESNKAN